MATDADRDVSYGEREVADRMNVPLGIGSWREPRGAAPLSQAWHASRAIETRPACGTDGGFAIMMTPRSEDTDRSRSLIRLYTHTCLFRQVRANFNRTPDCLLLLLLKNYANGG